MQIRDYVPSDWPALREFIETSWRAGHPYTHRELFEWQFNGFGAKLGRASKVLEQDGEVLGFLGAIPGQYWVDGRVVPGVVYDLWVVRKDLRNRALGLLMMRDLEAEYEVCCCLGVNLEVVKYYVLRGYGYCSHLHRYVAPIDEQKTNRLIAGSGGQAVTTAAWRPANADWPHVATPSDEISPKALQNLYEQTVERTFRFGVHRTGEYWNWRYLRSAGFRYLFFGHPAESGVVIARIESVISPETPELDGLANLRIIELLPARAEAWTGEPDRAFVELLHGVLAWAAKQGCALADFQHSSDRLGPLMAAAGFQSASDEASPAARVPNLFQPLRYNAQPINFVWRIANSLTGETPEPRDIYLVKSDDGMDRPNIWPMPQGRH